MAGTSLFALIDDIASLLDDIAVMTKVAAKKTAGVLGDDLALNAQQVLGLNAERELPVVWAVAVGSLKNKAILVPVALLISLFAPSLIPILLIVGGAFLCFEGVEKLVHPLLHAEELTQQRQLHAQALTQTTPEQLLDLERDKINGAIRTDFILSAEIIVISLGSLTEASASIADQIMVLVLIAVLMTVGVYGLVAGIVKLDDAGLYLTRQSSRILQVLGRRILAAAPWLMKSLSVVGTVAMFIVGGGIISHNIAWLHEQSLHLAQGVALATGLAGIAEAIVSAVVDMLLGVFTGALCLALFSLGRKCWGSKA